LFRLLLAVVLLVSESGIALAQQIGNDNFQLEFSSTGLKTLKRTRDSFDTNYILAGRALGDVFVRYRAPGGTWQEVSSATAGTEKDQGFAYAVGRAVPTIATASRTNSSIGPWGTRALNDQIEPASSHDRDIPFFAWGDRHGTSEWVEYQFGKPVAVSYVEVYWAVGSYDDDYKWDLPVSWKIQYRDGEQWKDVQTAGEYGLKLDAFNHVNFTPVTTQSLRLVAQLPQNATSAIYEWRVNTDQGKQVEPVSEISPSGSFHLEGDALVWSVEIRNQSASPIEIGDLGIRLPFNTEYVPDKTETYTKRLIRHSFIGGDGSYIFWTRCNGIGPYLVMTPEKGTHFEYFDEEEGRHFTAYVHSSGREGELAAKGGEWRLPNTSATLASKGSSGDSVHYSFKFHWAKDYDGVRDVLYKEGGFDFHVVPGMTVPIDLPTDFSLRTRNNIQQITAEHPQDTVIKPIGAKGKDTYLYSVKFSRLGENMLKVRYGDGQYLALDFFVTEPLETMIKKRARFLMTHEQWNDPKRWYNGLYSQWDMKDQKLRSPDDLDGLQSYAVACDDPALGKAPYLAAKNVFFPQQDEITSIENYIQHYVWGGLQQTDKEPYPYGIYGIPNWKVNRESQLDNERGKKHLWRIYDYPHVILLYYQMYLIAKNYPTMVRYLDASGYLDRAYGTAIAFFTVPMEIVKWSADETGTYNELVIPDLIRTLEEEGRKEQAEKLRAHWEAKAEFFINKQPDLFQSEYPFDSTGFESTHALAKYAVDRLREPGATEFRKAVKASDADSFLEEQMRLNVADRGMEPAYYWLGSDYRGSGNAEYTLSYMSQMGGWAVEDYALNFAHDPIPYLRLGYASYLSSWALLNSGTAESNYGYWYPGKENDGGAGGGFEPRPWGRAWLGNKAMGHGSWWYDGEIDLGFSGALRTAATVVSDDPIFGLYAYGGELTRNGKSIGVIPRDGLRERLDIVQGNVRFQMRLDRDGFAQGQAVAFTEALDRINFQIENRSDDKHETTLTLTGLPVGSYHLHLNKKQVASFIMRDHEEESLTISVPATGALLVTISR
jgi:Family of unknown function (DUF5695)/F5/8 type C domain